MEDPLTIFGIVWLIEEVVLRKIFKKISGKSFTPKKFMFFPEFDLLESFPGCFMRARLMFHKTWKIPRACMEKLSRNTMQLPRLQLQLKTQLLHRLDHFDFTLHFLNKTPAKRRDNFRFLRLHQLSYSYFETGNRI